MHFYLKTILLQPHLLPTIKSSLFHLLHVDVLKVNIRSSGGLILHQEITFTLVPNFQRLFSGIRND